MTQEGPRLEANVLYHLPSDTVFFNPSEVDLSEAAIDGVLISRRHSRLPSRAMSSDLASLLQEFVEPATVVEAAVAFGKKHQQDPEKLLDQIVEPLNQLLQAGYLEAVSDQEAASPYKIPESVADQIIDCDTITTREGSALYRINHKTHGIAALRVLYDPTDTASNAVLIEHKALSALQASRVPQVIFSESNAESTWLMSSWIHGRSLNQMVLGMRKAPLLYSVRTRSLLALSLVELLQSIHESGWTHGDINPRNFVVPLDGDVYAVDFEKARPIGLPSEPVDEVSLHYLAPEQVLDKDSVSCVSATPPAEQYSASVVIGEILFDWFQQDLALSLTELLSRVREGHYWKQQLDLHLPDCPLRNALTRALHPAPAKRFPSLQAFLEALGNALEDFQPAVHKLPIQPAALVEEPPLHWVQFQKKLAWTLPTKDDSLSDTSHSIDRVDWVATRFPGLVDLNYFPDLNALLGTEEPELSPLEGHLSNSSQMDLGDCDLGTSTGPGADLILLCALHQRSDSLALRNCIDSHAERNLELISTHNQTSKLSQAGIAHGLLGNVLALALWSQFSGAPLSSSTIEIALSRMEYELERYHQQSGNQIAWLCRGIPGYLLLLNSLSSSNSWPQGMQRMEQLAKRLVSEEARNWTICCGSLGQAIALHLSGIRLRDEQFLQAAARRLRDSIEAARKEPKIPSLWKGHWGIALTEAVIAGEPLEGSALFGFIQ